jgi:hypothetical protein
LCLLYSLLLSCGLPFGWPWNPRLPALRIASIVSSTVNNLVVLIALTCPGISLTMIDDDVNIVTTIVVTKREYDDSYRADAENWTK